MVPSDDWWRHNSPWPGHDTQGPGHAPGELPGSFNPPPIVDFPPFPPPSTGGGGYGAPIGMAMGGQVGTGCGLVLGLVILFASVPKALAILPILYPLVAAVEIGVMRASLTLVNRFDPGATAAVRLALAVAAPFVLLWPMSRIEQRLATLRVYRVARHIVRLSLIGIVVWWLARTLPEEGPPPPWLHPLHDLFRTPTQLAVTIGAVLIAHLFLTKAKGIQASWHRLLESLRLRSDAIT